MRRKDREITSTKEIAGILDLCKTCHLAMVDDGRAYVVPLSFAYELGESGLTLYFHSAKEGRKLDILRKNSAVCFEICTEGEPIFSASTPCNSGYYFSSVHGFGDVRFVEDIGEKRAALSLLMQHQAGMAVKFTGAQAASVCVYKIVTTDFTGKKKPRPAERGAAIG